MEWIEMAGTSRRTPERHGTAHEEFSFRFVSFRFPRVNENYGNSRSSLPYFSPGLLSVISGD